MTEDEVRNIVKQEIIKLLKDLVAGLRFMEGEIVNPYKLRKFFGGILMDYEEDS